MKTRKKARQEARPEIFELKGRLTLFPIQYLLTHMYI